MPTIEPLRLEHMNKYQARELEERWFNLATADLGEQLLYTPNIMLLYDGYACQADGLTIDFTEALEIKSLTQKNFQKLGNSESAVYSKYQKIIYKYFLANPYLTRLSIFIINREDESERFVCRFDRPERYEIEVKRAHQGEAKIKGDYRCIDFNMVDLDSARDILLMALNRQGELELP